MPLCLLKLFAEFNYYNPFNVSNINRRLAAIKELFRVFVAPHRYNGVGVDRGTERTPVTIYYYYNNIIHLMRLWPTT